MIPNSKVIPYARQDIDEADIAAVVDVLRSDWLTQGPHIAEFEKKVADACGVQYAVALSSATAALHLGCLALGLKAGEELWTSPLTFVASSNCALYCGGKVDFIDVDARTYNMCPRKLEEKLKEAAARNRLPKIIVPVHLTGQPCEMQAIADLARKYSIAVMEDAAHALGAEYQSTKVGSCTYSDLTVLSFHPVKIIATGEGGMILTNRFDLYEKLLRLRTHGITREPHLLKNESHGAWYYEQQELGYHYRMTDLQAALGTSQMSKLGRFLKRRRELAEQYDLAMAHLPLTLPWQHPDTLSSYHLYVVRLQLSNIKKSHQQVFEELRAHGIGVNLHYIPVYKQPYYQQLGFPSDLCPHAESYYHEAISLPMYASLTDEDQRRVIQMLEKVLLS